MTSRSRVWRRRALIAGLVVLLLQQLWRHGHDYIWPEQFAEVVPGKIYRGAWQQTWPMRRIVRDHHIKTVVALAHKPTDPLSLREKSLMKEMGVRWVHIPIVDDRTMANGEDLSDRLERAAAELAKSENQPVYFHCHHGINRASMVQIAYRTLYCGWTLEQANAEISHSFGLVEESHGPDYRFMETFYRDRVLPLRRQQASQRHSAAPAESTAAVTPESPTVH